VTLTALSLSHLAHGITIVTGADGWEAWAMSVGIDLGFVALELSQLAATHERVRKQMARFAKPAIIGTLIGSAGMNAFAFAAQTVNPWMMAAAVTAWTSDGFRASWGKACDKAGIDDLTFHDFRGSAVTRLFMAGATVAETASITGHSLHDVEAILDAHYFGRTTELAVSGIAKLERNGVKPPVKLSGESAPDT
jgi:integrase